MLRSGGHEKIFLILNIARGLMGAMIDVVAASLGVNRHRVETFNLHAKSFRVLHIVVA